ncbi:MAG TPA: antitermination regulator, partial [Actinoplanes sp.]|nr:antitermination regulator [Actinoplanes sp.]
MELAGLLHELTARLLSADNFSQALERLTVFTAGAVPGVVRSSVVLIGEGGPLTCTAHGPIGAAVDELQYELSVGPGLEAARTRALVTVSDLTADPRW